MRLRFQTQISPEKLTFDLLFDYLIFFVAGLRDI